MDRATYKQIQRSIRKAEKSAATAIKHMMRKGKLGALLATPEVAAALAASDPTFKLLEKCNLKGPAEVRKILEINRGHFSTEDLENKLKQLEGFIDARLGSEEDTLTLMKDRYRSAQAFHDACALQKRLETYVAHHTGRDFTPDRVREAMRDPSLSLKEKAKIRRAAKMQGAKWEDETRIEGDLRAIQNANYDPDSLSSNMKRHYHYCKNRLRGQAAGTALKEASTWSAKATAKVTKAGFNAAIHSAPARAAGYAFHNAKGYARRKAGSVGSVAGRGGRRTAGAARGAAHFTGRHASKIANGFTNSVKRTSVNVKNSFAKAATKVNDFGRIKTPTWVFRLPF